MLLKNFFFTFTNYFWNLLVLDNTEVICPLFFSWFMLFASITLLDMTKNPSCILLSKSKCNILAINSESPPAINSFPVAWSGDCKLFTLSGNLKFIGATKNWSHFRRRHCCLPLLPISPLTFCQI
jgi:hypothetical protein